MSAEILREAASLMRERATAAPVPAGPWEAEFSDVIRTDVPFGDMGYLITECATTPEAKHIASWHPAVALAVANWLDLAASDVWAYGPMCECGTGCDACDDSLWEEHARKALTAARTFLGRDQ